MSSWFATTEADTSAVEEAPWQRALTVCVVTTTLALLLDFCLVRRIVPDGARYFVCHACFNTWLTCVVLSDSLEALQNPSQALLGDDKGGWADSAVVTTAGITGFHVYHMLAFKGISAEDWVHHLVSCVLVPIIGVGCPFGRVVSVSNLGMCGIPGGIDYALLAGVKLGVVPRMAEKNINSMLNLLLRWPLMLLSTYLFGLGWLNGTLAGASARGAQLWVRFLMAVAVLLHTANAAYYAQKVIGNAHVTAAKEREARATKKQDSPPPRTDAFPISEERKREMVTSGSSGDFKDFTCD